LCDNDDLEEVVEDDRERRLLFEVISFFLGHLSPTILASGGSMKS